VSQRDYEDQPEAPDLGEFVQEDTAETLVGPPGSDPLDAGYIPPDRPYGIDDDQTTTRIDTEPEPLDIALRRERPDIDPDDPASGSDGEPDRSGRLASSAPGADGDYGDSVDGEDVGIDGGAASAEEAAVHERAFGTGLSG
jgi:hypothetical protein